MESITASSVVVLDADGTRANSEALADILISCVQSGASVSFMAPLERQKALDFWLDIADSVERGERLLLAAVDQKNGQAVGTVQVYLKQTENQPHRADLAKMLVHPDARRRGIGTLLMNRAEELARDEGKTLLVLDTATGGEAERLYERLGWNRAGVIPDYALWPDGRLCSTTILYKHL
jgi:GNAT superfamily N-acetyltransferase